jgi:hypothetical protein
MPYRLAIDDDGRPAQTLEVRAARLSVGAHRSCRVRLRSRGVAPRHAIFREAGGRVSVEHPEGAPGLVVDGRPVSQAELSPGAVVALGEARLRLVGVTHEPRADPRRLAAPPRPKPRRARTPGGSPPPGAILDAAAPRGVLRGRRLRWGAAGVSVVLHAVLLLVLGTVVLFQGRAREVSANYEVAVAEGPVELRPDDEPPDLVTPPEWERPPETKEPPPEDPFADVFAEPFREPDPPPLAAPPPLERLPVAEAPPATIGVGGTPEIPSTSFGKEGAARANGAAAELFEGDGGGGALLRRVRGAASSARVWVVRGDYDQAEKVLELLEVPHLVVARESLEAGPPPPSLRVLVFNCTGKPLSDAAARGVAGWVEAGGCVVSTDWGLERLVVRSFPGRLEILRGGTKTSLTPDETVGARALGTHALLDGVPLDVPFRWWLEESSVPFRAAEDGGADVLVRSETLGRRNGADAVAAVFAHGRGSVLHLLGHIYQQEGTLAGAYAMQRIVVNFLDRALRD